MIKEKYSKINEAEMDFSEHFDRVFTKLTLDDYDWMSYDFQAIFPFGGELLILNVNYFGFNKCEVKLELKKGEDTPIEEKYEVSADIVKDFMKKFTKAHMEHWDKPEAFYGGDLAIDFYNKIMENAKIPE